MSLTIRLPPLGPSLTQVVQDLRQLPSWARAPYLRSLVQWRDGTLPPEVGPDARVLVLCQGNILRSPFAAAMLRHELELRGATAPSVESAGVLTVGGRPAHSDARRIANTYGVSLETHRTTPVSPDIVGRADLVVVMDRLNEALLRARWPELRAPVIGLGAFDPEAPGEIRDPYGAGDGAGAECYVRIARSARALARALCDGQRPADAERALPRRIAAAAAFGTPAVRVWRPFAQHSAAVFVMHRFTAAESGASGETPRDLARNLEFLRRHRFTLASVDELVRTLDDGRPLPPRTVAFTIDDGYRDVLEVAAPVFAAYDCPFTVYVVTGFLDGRCWLWWDRVLYAFGYAARGEWAVPVAGTTMRVTWASHAERRRNTRAFVQALKGMPTDVREAAILALEALAGRPRGQRPPPTAAALTWDEVRAMRAKGATFGPHTDTHPILSQCTPEEARAEVRRSVQRFTEELGAPPLTFAYPNGTGADFDGLHCDAVRTAGVRAAMAFDGRYLTAGQWPRQRYALSRLPYESDPLRFRQLVSGAEQWRMGVWRH